MLNNTINFRDKFISDAIALIESKYNHLTDKERNDLMFFKNQKKLNPHTYNKLKELAERCKVRY